MRSAHDRFIRSGRGGQKGIWKIRRQGEGYLCGGEAEFRRSAAGGDFAVNGFEMVIGIWANNKNMIPLLYNEIIFSLFFFIPLLILLNRIMFSWKEYFWNKIKK